MLQMHVPRIHVIMMVSVWWMKTEFTVVACPVSLEPSANRVCEFCFLHLPDEKFKTSNTVFVHMMAENGIVFVKSLYFKSKDQTYK